MSLTITPYDGVDVIGGNKILVESQGRAVFLDFGTPYSIRNRFFEEYLSPRAGRGLLDPIVMGLIPPLWGIYRTDLEPPEASIKPRMERMPGFRELALDGIILSHAHLDHCGYLSFLRSDIPIYTGATTAVVAKAFQDSGKSSDFEQEVCYLTPRVEQEGLLTAANYRTQAALGRPVYLVDEPALSPVEGPAIDQSLADFWARSPATRGLNCQPLLPAHQVGGMALRRFPVDHSIPGASAFALETAEGWVVYTGDLRWHGAQRHLTEAFVEQAARLYPLALICEGTNTGPEPPTSEEEVHSRCLEAVRAEPGLVIADFAARNLERLLTFRDIACQTGRCLAILGKDAYLLDAMRCLAPDVPDLAADKALCLYMDAKRAQLKWEKEVRQRYQARLVGPAEVCRSPGSYILALSFFDIHELPDLNPDGGGSYIYSTSEAYSEEQKIDLERLRHWLEHFHMRFVGDYERGERGFHASGHMTGPDILRLVRAIKPRFVIPVHTEKPEFFLDNLGSQFKVMLPTAGQPISW